jgi:hypothetical protein
MDVLGATSAQWLFKGPFAPCHRSQKILVTAFLVNHNNLEWLTILLMSGITADRWPMASSTGGR